MWKKMHRAWGIAHRVRDRVDTDEKVRRWEGEELRRWEGEKVGR
jgi:hypothetical protein